MRPVVRCTDFREHTNDDSEESRQFRHCRAVHRSVVTSSRPAALDAAIRLLDSPLVRSSHGNMMATASGP
jgi:hypothetical protein